LRRTVKGEFPACNPDPVDVVTRVIGDHEITIDHDVRIDCHINLEFLQLGKLVEDIDNKRNSTPFLRGRKSIAGPKLRARAAKFEEARLPKRTEKVA